MILFGDFPPWGGENLDMSTSRLSAFRIPGKFTCAFLGTLAIAANIAGCGGYGGGGSSNYPITVSVSPKRGGLTTSQTLPFTATVQNDSANAGVTWSATCAASPCGSFSPPSTASGVATTYTAPAAAGVMTISAMSLTDGTKSASAIIGVTDLKGIFSWRGMESDTTRQGVNSKEYALTPATVSGSTFGKLFSCPANGSLDGFVFAQPLYVANLTVGGSKHNIVFVATEGDSLYAFDADSSPCVTLWHASFTLPGPPTGVTPIPNTEAGNNNIGPNIGITGTPVIDLSSNTLFVVVATKENTSGFINYFQRLHALDLASGSERSGSPVSISASVPGAGDGGTTILFNPLRNNQRPGLLLANGNVYISWASHDDTAIYHGWVIAYSASNLQQQVTAFSPTPNGTSGKEGGIWMSGAAPAADSTGNIYLSVGNGTFDDMTGTVPPVAPNNDFGDSVLKLSSTLSVADFFTPFDQSSLNSADIDLGSTGMVLLPDLSGTARTHLMVCGGKSGKIYLIDRDNLGKFSSASDAVVQVFQLSGDLSNGFRSTPAFFNNSMYAAGQGDPLMAVAFSSSTPQFSPTTPVSKSANTYSGYGTNPAVSALGMSNGVVWTIDVGPEVIGVPSVAAILRAYDATDLTKLLYHSDAKPSDAAGTAVKFTMPTVANGKVYVGTQTELDVYGLLP